MITKEQAEVLRGEESCHLLTIIWYNKNKTNVCLLNICMYVYVYTKAQR